MNDGAISVLFLLCCVLAIYGVNHFIRKRDTHLKTQHIKNFGKSSEAEMYIYMVIDLIQKRSISFKRGFEYKVFYDRKYTTLD